MGDEEVRPLARREEIVVGVGQRRHHLFADDALGPLAKVHDVGHQLRRGVAIGQVRPDGGEPDAARFETRSR